jgi:hypothetical protein
MNTQKWMKELSDAKLLRQIVMPGSHDAGVYGTAQTVLRASPLVKNEYVVCQHSDFSRQATAGSRFFDCRVFFQKIPQGERQSPDQKYKNVLGHFAKEKQKTSKEPTMGGYGGALAAVLGQALDFVIANTTEFIILRFSHTYHPTECINEIKQIVKSKPTYQGAVYKDPGNIAMRRVGDLRGKVIMVFDEKFNHHITPTEGVHRFSKYKEGSSNIDGLATCGTFASSMDMKKVHGETMTAVENHLKNHPGDGAGHLHFIYWQQTQKNPFGEKDIYKTTTASKQPGKEWSGGAHANLGDLMSELDAKRQSSGNRLAVNVLSHDFVDAGTCEKIIKLNPGYP